MKDTQQHTRMDAPATILDEPLDGAALRALGILPSDDHPPFDILGDVHGCVDELRAMLQRLGYAQFGAAYRHPQGRRVVFVGDLVDRGPASLEVLTIVRAMREEGAALAILGNHDFKFLRWLRGEHVRMAYGLALTVNELLTTSESELATLRTELAAFFASLPAYLMLDGGRLVVTHGAILDSMLGRWNETVASYCLYGEVRGVTARGKPLRYDWGAARAERFGPLDSSPYIVYGHNVVSGARWVNRTLDLDTGCVYGGALTALRYPEMEIYSVPAARAYFIR